MFSCWSEEEEKRILKHVRCWLRKGIPAASSIHPTDTFIQSEIRFSQFGDAHSASKRNQAWNGEPRVFSFVFTGLADTMQPTVLYFSESTKNMSIIGRFSFISDHTLVFQSRWFVKYAAWFSIYFIFKLESTPRRYGSQRRSCTVHGYSRNVRIGLTENQVLLMSAY